MVEICFSCIAVPLFVFLSIVYYILDFFGLTNTSKEGSEAKKEKEIETFGDEQRKTENKEKNK